MALWVGLNKNMTRNQVMKVKLSAAFKATTGFFGQFVQILQAMDVSAISELPGRNVADISARIVYRIVVSLSVTIDYVFQVFKFRTEIGFLDLAGSAPDSGVQGHLVLVQAID